MSEQINTDLRLKGARKLAEGKAKASLWKKGFIRDMLLDSCQLAMLQEFEASKVIKYVILCSRRLGKTFMLSTYATECAYKKPNQQIKYITSTAKAAREFALPIFNRLLSECPAEHRPTYMVHDSKWVFPNGSEILLVGTDKDRGENLRGQSADLAIIDEAGFAEGLDSLISDILMPMIVERNGRVLLSSTPPKDSNHPFLYLVAEAERKGAISRRVLTDCPRFTSKQIETFIEEAGGRNSETCRREYFVEIIRDTTQAIVPEFNDITEKIIVVSEFDKLDYRPDTYVSLDPGFVDNAAVLFGYWDFPNATLCIQREFLSSGNNTAEIADAVKFNESMLWGNFPPYKRVSDTDLRLIKDLKDLHSLKFTKTEKDNKEAQVNVLRIMIKNRQIKIHKSCTNLISQLKYGQYKISASGNRDFKRTTELGHCDAIDALLYMIRNISKQRNPINEDTFNQYTQFDPWRDSRKQTINAKKLSRAFK